MHVYIQRKITHDMYTRTYIHTYIHTEEIFRLGQPIELLRLLDEHNRTAMTAACKVRLYVIETWICTYVKIYHEGSFGGVSACKNGNSDMLHFDSVCVLALAHKHAHRDTCTYSYDSCM